MDFHTFDDVQDHLDSLGLFHMDFELDRMHKALSALGLTQSVPFVVVQVVGTNGKGSTSTFLASLARAHGLKTGLYTSPHFVTPRERIRINGRMLDAERWPELASRVMNAAPDLTYFEFLTALGLLAFAEAGVDLVVLEAGLGGHHDATTAMLAHAVCFTPVSMDHEAVLGPTLTAIATDKAHAMRPGVPAFTAPQTPEALRCLRQMAKEKGVILHELPNTPTVANVPGVDTHGCLATLSGTTAPHPEPLAAAFASAEPFPCEKILGLSGPHQQINASLALTVWEHLATTCNWPLKPDAVCEALASARLAGRLQYVPPQYLQLEPFCVDKAHLSDGDCRQDNVAPSPQTQLPLLPPLLLDGAHNPHGLQALEIALKTEDITPCAVIFSCLSDKNMEDMLPVLCRLAGDAPIIVPTIQDNERAMLGTVLAERIQALRLDSFPQTAQHGQHKPPRTLSVQRLSLALKEAAAEMPPKPAAQPLNQPAQDSFLRHHPVLLCGSLYLLGEFFTLHPRALETDGDELSLVTTSGNHILKPETAV